MFSFAPLALAALALSSVSAMPIPNRHKAIAARASAPAGWAHGYLESYDVYHARYDALSCKSQHDTTFFDECCHPLLATETLAANRPAQCNPANLSSSAAATTAAATTTASPAAATTTSDDEEYCDEETSSAAAAAPTTTAASTTTAEVAAAVVVPTTTAETTTAWVAPTTTKKAATTTTEAAPAATTTAASSSSENTGGSATYFLQNGNPGACGNYNSDSTPLVAVPYKWWGTSDSQTSDLCGKYVNIERVSDGAKVTAIIADLCPTCTTDNSLDLSTGAFLQIATEAEGMVEIKWSLA